MRKGLFARSISSNTSRSTSAASLLTQHSTTATAESASAFRISSVQRSTRVVGRRSGFGAARYYARASSPLYAAAASAATEKAPDMFCFQCEQTRDNKGCTTVGVCGKTPEVAALQDLLMHALKGVSMYANQARQIGGASFADAEVDSFALRALFSTLTNVNFDDKRFREYLEEAARMKAKAKALYEKACASKGKTAGHLDGDLDPTSWTWNPKASTEELVAQGHAVGILPRKERYGPDLSGLQEMVLYGLKGMAAYADHALVLDKQSDATYAFLHSALDKLTKKNPSAEELLGLALEVGAANISVMGMLDAGATERYGHPVPTKVLTSVKKGKCVGVSGHDLRDLEEVLKQTAGKGINVYTHGELLPAHGYPGLKDKYPHLIGNYGGAWQQQKSEFAAFPGPILMTTNCIIEPRKSYKDRIYTRSVVGWPGCTHLPDYDFTKLVEHAQRMPGFAEDDEETYTMTGFARNAVLGVADKVVEAVKAGQIKHFFLIGGCDGAEGERNYFKEMALSTPKDTVVLTLACGKYRFNKHFKDFGDIGGIPRLLDVGQCNDAYSAVQIAVALAKAFNTDVNGLPLSFVISWFEQKAVAVLLSLLYLNVKNIHLGPNLPAFCTPNMLQILVDKFGIRQITDAKADMARMMQKN